MLSWYFVKKKYLHRNEYKDTMLMSDRYAMHLEVDDDGDYFMKIPEDLVNDLRWVEGDTLDFEEDIDGTVILTKVQKKSP
jgi:hypothetical protein